MTDYPTAINPHDQPHVNSLTDTARTNSIRQCQMGDQTAAIELARNFNQLFALTGIPPAQLAPYCDPTRQYWT